ncbi:MAG TPA: 4-hydroxythreonine-4-phosphate dehydrogenase PdxA, partial [Gammaproteobacteria bacterium]|nr:4-hydroxythreonine-4-phosphate dehydrogenase PdxA [Gammaproteobacteria bacterium]
MRLALSVGEPAGIGPDLAVLAAQRVYPFEIVAFASPSLLASRATALGLALAIERYDSARVPAPAKAGHLVVAPQPLVNPAIAGRLDRANAAPVLGALDAAFAACSRGECDALVTAPLHKGIINDAGIAFRGHTEYLAELAGGATPVMLLVAGELRVALATTHLPLAEVPRAITAARLRAVIEALSAGLARDFGIAEPRILVLGLNPHAGEGGHLGGEEQAVIAPTLAALRGRGYRLAGPVPADTAFVPARLAQTDAVLAMYHDQGLPVLKYAGFG